MRSFFYIIVGLMLFTSSAVVNAKNPHHHVQVQLGDIYIRPSHQDQTIGITDELPDVFSVTSYTNPQRFLFGLGLFFDLPFDCRDTFSLGLDAFYFGQITVKGDILQQQTNDLFRYQYAVTNFPIFAATKATLRNDHELFNDMAITLDFGIGPNIQTTRYNQYPTDSLISIQPSLFFGKNDLSGIGFAATAGVGLKLDDFLITVPLECGYRFFYLGQGKLSINSNANVETNLAIPSLAQAVVCSITF